MSNRLGKNMSDYYDCYKPISNMFDESGKLNWCATTTFKEYVVSYYCRILSGVIYRCYETRIKGVKDVRELIVPLDCDDAMLLRTIKRYYYDDWRFIKVRDYDSDWRFKHPLRQCI